MENEISLRDIWRQGWFWLACSAAAHAAVLLGLPDVHMQPMPPKEYVLVELANNEKKPQAAQSPISAKAVRNSASAAPRTAAKSHPRRPQPAKERTPVLAGEHPRVAQVVQEAEELRQAAGSEVSEGQRPADGPSELSEVAQEAEAAATVSLAAAIEGPGPTPLEPAVDVEALKRVFAARALSKVQRSKFYPDEARTHESRDKVFRVAVTFQVASDGELLSVTVKSPSGNSLIDRAAVSAVQRAAPFGRFPPGLDLHWLALGATLEYRIATGN